MNLPRISHRAAAQIATQTGQSLAYLCKGERFEAKLGKNEISIVRPAATVRKITLVPRSF